MQTAKYPLSATFLLLASTALSAGENDYPTLARVDHVMTCMKQHGGQTLDNLYACACEIDAIAAKMNYPEFENATTFAAMRNMPGERGGIYRQSEEGETAVNRLKEAQEAANTQCFLRPKGAVAKKSEVAQPTAAAKGGKAKP